AFIPAPKPMHPARGPKMHAVFVSRPGRAPGLECRGPFLTSHPRGSEQKKRRRQTGHRMNDIAAP
ncbi:MAG: hypothetical protein OEL50_01015, partial [Rhodospirillaceae bacterium]|nr:hypothetical protein [Rhodospirillaceae bacterium]